MKSEELKQIALKAQCNINDEINSFIQKLDAATDDPDNFITMTQLEEEWGKLNSKTHKLYSDMVSESLTAVDTKELNSAKKESTSRTGSD